MSGAWTGRFRELRRVGKYSEAFEMAAERFHDETGIMAPGKDLPAAMADSENSDFQVRMNRWETWLAEQGLRSGGGDS